MITNYRTILCAILLNLTTSLSTQAAGITNAGDTGRLGDALMNYIKAKFIAHKYNIPFFLTTFPHADELVLFGAEKHGKGWFDREKTIRHESQLRAIDPSILYYIGYHCVVDGWADPLDITTWYTDEEFRDSMRYLIQPKKLLHSIELPIDKITVAVHVRRPSHHDTPLCSLQEYDVNIHPKLGRVPTENFVQMVDDKPSDALFPYKFPPDQYYIDQIKRLHAMVDYASLYIYIFSDDRNPESIAHRYENAVGAANITFACRKNGSHETCILEDLFNMCRFNCLIRSNSNFAQIAEFLGNHKIIIYPKTAFWYTNPRRLVIGEVVIQDKRTVLAMNKLS